MRINEIRYETKISLEKYDEERITMTCYLDDEDTVEGAIAYCRKVSRGDIPYKPLAKELFPDEVIKEIASPSPILKAELAKKEEIVPKKEEIAPKKEPKKEAIKKEIAEKKEIAPKKEEPTFTKVVMEEKAPIEKAPTKDKSYGEYLAKWDELSLPVKCAVEFGIRKESGTKLDLSLFERDRVKSLYPNCKEFKNEADYKTPISALLSRKLPYDEYEVDTVRPYILETVQKVNRTCPMYSENMELLPEFETLFWEEIFSMSHSAHEAILRLWGK